MEQGVIFTQDKKDIEVFFLKPQPPVRQETDERDVNENSAGAGAHEIKHHECFGDTHVSCCPVGHKGHQGQSGINEDDTLYGVVLDSVKKFENTQLNIASETAQEVLALVISKRVKALHEYKGNLK